MLKFYFLRSSRDIIGHIILIVMPVILIAFLSSIYQESLNQAVLGGGSSSVITVLTIGFALTFQIYGGAISYETIGADFYSPMRGRLQASPKEPRDFILAIISTSIMMSFLQTLLILTFSVLFLDARIPSLFYVFMIMIVSTILNQLLGAVIMLKTGKVKTATTIMNFYGIAAPMLAGLYFPLPDYQIFTLIRQYLTPLALANTAILGAMNRDYSRMFISALPLLVLCILLFMAIRPLSRRVIE